MSLIAILLELSPICAIFYLFLFWTRRKSSRPPNVFCKKSLFNSLAVQYCDDLLSKPYVPTLWAFSPRIHSTYFAVKPAWPIDCKTEYLEVQDGRLLGILWPKLGASTGAKLHMPVVIFVTDPLANDNRIQPYIEAAVKHGSRPSVFLHRRSKALPRLRHASECSSLDRSYSSDDMDDWKDLGEVVTYIASKFPVAPLYLVSLSYGCPTLLKFLAYNAKSRFLKGVACVSPVWNTFKPSYLSLTQLPDQSKPSGASFKHSISFDSFFRGLSRCRNHSAQLDRSRRHATTLPTEVFSKLKKLTIPMLIIFSSDDPLLSSDSKYRIGGAWKNSELLLVVETFSGGHAGFLEGLAPDSWAAKLVFLYFEAVDKFKEATIG